MKAINRIFIVVMLLMFGIPAYAEENAAQTEATSEEIKPAMTEKMKAQMVPNENHKVLENFIGNWDYLGKFWMTSEASAQDMTGTAKHEMIFGGRFLKQEIEGPWMGEQFQGLGFTGYDNIKAEYETIWLDSVGTGIMKVSGTYDPATKTLSQSGANSCPLTGEKAKPGRSEWKIVDADHSTYTSYTTGPDGKEFKSMEMNYTRA